jgi:predicted transcriptional regulator
LLHKDHKGESAQVTALHAVNAAKVVELVSSGMTITKTAETLNITRNMASKLLHDTLAETLAERSADRQQLLAQQLETYRLLKRAWMPSALSPKNDKAVQAARIVLEVLDKENELLGLNAAIRLEISNARINETLADVVQLMESSDDDVPLILDAEDIG